jgi:hypothetical protein
VEAESPDQKRSLGLWWVFSGLFVLQLLESTGVSSFKVVFKSVAQL